jgi:hypothetical protein
VFTREGQGFFSRDVIRQSFGQHVHPDLQIVKGFLWFSVPNSVEEYPWIALDLNDATASFYFLCPLLAYDLAERPSI